MIAVRLIGIVLALIGMAFFLLGLLSGNTGANSDSLNVAVFAMVAGLIVALGADAGQKLEQRSKDAKAAQAKKAAAVAGGEKKPEKK